VVSCNVWFWVETGVLDPRKRCPYSQAFGQHMKPTNGGRVQLSDSHMGFNKPANLDVLGMLQASIARSMRFHRNPISSFTPETWAIHPAH
jgi:hypothetical protein